MQLNAAKVAPHAPPSNAESIVPNVALLRQPQVVGAIFPGCAASLWRHVKAGTFPAPVKIGGRMSAWRRDDLVRWIEQQGAEVKAA
jgi:predicted DNA-binding transcriptional regulator AlpA